MKRLVLLALFTSLTAQAYSRAADPETEVCLFWTDRSLHWVLNDDGVPGRPLEETEAALVRSADAWSAAACSDVTLSYDGKTPRRDVGYDLRATDNINLILWRGVGCDGLVPASDGCHDTEDEDPFACANKYDCWLHGPGIIALTTTSYNRRTGAMVDADIEFNASTSIFRFTTTEATGPTCTMGITENCVAMDVENAATHELGHFLGLAHSSVGDATMYASAPPGETIKRDLADDDREGLCTIYPSGGAVETCTPSGEITLSQGASTESGCTSVSPATLALMGLGAALRRKRRRQESP